MKFIPLHNNVIIKQQDETETMYGNIIVPDTGKERPLLGEVIAVGSGFYTITGNFIKTITKVGEIVVFPSFGGQRITIEGEDFIVVKEQDLIAILKK